LEDDEKAIHKRAIELKVKLDEAKELAEKFMK
jgi:hypothetical protein